MNILTLFLLATSAAPFTIEIPEGDVDVDTLTLYLFETPIRVTADRITFVDSFEGTP